MDVLIEMGVEGLEVWYGMMTEEEREQAVKLAYAKDLCISGGSDHSGMSDGPTARKKKSADPTYQPLKTYGTTKQYFEQIRDRKLNRW